MIRSTNPARMIEFVICRLLSKLKTDTPWKDNVTQSSLEGTSLHLFVAGADETAVRKQLARDIAKASGVDNLQLEAKVDNIIAKGKSMSNKVQANRSWQTKPENIENQFKLALFGGWQLNFKPDYWDIIVEERTGHYPSGRPKRGLEKVLVIVEVKKTWRLRPPHWKQAMSFAVLLAEYKEHTGPVEIRMMCGEEPRKSEAATAADAEVGGEVAVLEQRKVEPIIHRMSRNAILQHRAWMFGLLAEMDRAWDNDDFPATAGKHCFRCIGKDTCAAGRKYITRRNVVNRAWQSLRQAASVAASETLANAPAAQSVAVDNAVTDKGEHAQVAALLAGPMEYSVLGSELFAFDQSFYEVLCDDGIWNVIVESDEIDGAVEVVLADYTGFTAEPNRTYKLRSVKQAKEAQLAQEALDDESEAVLELDDKGA